MENTMKIQVSNGQELEYTMETVVALCLTHDITPEELPGFIMGQVIDQVNKALAPFNDLITRRVVDEFRLKGTVKDNGASISFDYQHDGYSQLEQDLEKARDVLTVNGARNVTEPKSYGKRTKAERYHGSRIAKTSNPDKSGTYMTWSQAILAIKGEIPWSTAKQLMRDKGAKTHSDVVETYGWLLEQGLASTVNYTHKKKAPDGLTGEYIRVL